MTWLIFKSDVSHFIFLCDVVRWRWSRTGTEQIGFFRASSWLSKSAWCVRDTRVKLHIRMYDVTRWFVWHFLCVYVCHDLFIRVPWLTWDRGSHELARLNQPYVTYSAWRPWLGPPRASQSSRSQSYTPVRWCLGSLQKSPGKIRVRHIWICIYTYNLKSWKEPLKDTGVIRMYTCK